MAESLPPPGQRRRSVRNSRKRSLEVDEAEQPAEKSTDLKNEESTESSESAPASMECAICLQTCVHPARLPCGHIFCFLCIKGIFRTSEKCAMCRMVIPSDYLEMPDLLEVPEPSIPAADGQEAFQWFYEGRHGWWEYDPRANADLEAAFLAGESKAELLIAGCLYLIDLHGMMQYNKNDPGKRRTVKRDRVGVACKGVAGIRPALLRSVGPNVGRSRSQSTSPDSRRADHVASIFRRINWHDDDGPQPLAFLGDDDRGVYGRNMVSNYSPDESSLEDAFSRLNIRHSDFLSPDLAISDNEADNDDDDNDESYD
ncbi:RING finger protein [Nesidiocoris tenuis]|uniref:E3 ubiquitin-protein ligase n=1 Tax=Nesidiocoris tenuis TaxID=355587 RepID=A0ABN7BFN3_9HEMI|nr:RING finger protein [Nesidiocoris tenuis]